MAEETKWTTISVSEGRLTAENSEGVRLNIFADFSGVITLPNDKILEIDDLRTFIDAGKFLEQILVERYGGYK